MKPGEKREWLYRQWLMCIDLREASSRLLEEGKRTKAEHEKFKRLEVKAFYDWMREAMK